jgi:hypothetical protein
VPQASLKILIFLKDAENAFCYIFLEFCANNFYLIFANTVTFSHKHCFMPCSPNSVSYYGKLDCSSIILFRNVLHIFLKEWFTVSESLSGVHIVPFNNLHTYIWCYDAECAVIVYHKLCRWQWFYNTYYQRSSVITLLRVAGYWL